MTADVVNAVEAPTVDVKEHAEGVVEEKQNRCRVYVGNLDWGVSDEDLSRVMSDAGEVVSAAIQRNVDGRSKGYALVDYSSEQEAVNAINTLNESRIGERNVFVREDREPRKGGAGQTGEFARRPGFGYGKGKGMRPAYNGKGFAKGGFGGYPMPAYGMRAPFVPGKGYGRGIAPLRVTAKDKGRLLYVGNVPFRSSWQDLKDIFKAYGEVIRVDIPMDNMGRSRGYATVLFENAASAGEAISNLHDFEFNGRRLVVREDNFAARMEGPGDEGNDANNSEEVAASQE